jgi:hypothetical protein
VVHVTAFFQALVGKWVEVDGDDRRFFLLSLEGTVATLSRTKNGPRYGVIGCHSIRGEFGKVRR